MPPPAPAQGAAEPAAGRGPSLLVGRARSIDGEPVPLRRFRGGAVLVVDTASRCGFTDQLAGLEALHRERRADGLTVVGFPSHDIRQELAETSPSTCYGRGRLVARFAPSVEPDDPTLAGAIEAVLAELAL